MTQLGTPEFLELGDQEDNPIGRYWWDRLECHIKTSVGLNKAIILKKMQNSNKKNWSNT